MQTIQFIHAADLHLDSPFKGLQSLPPHLFQTVKESTFSAFTNLVDLAIEKQVDFMLLAGDLYDGEMRSLKAQIRLRNEFMRLGEASIPVYVLHGNHDHTGGSWIDLSWPAHVHFFSDSEVECKTFIKNGEVAAHIYGFSYPSRAVTANMAEMYQKQGDSSVYHIGMLHGSLEGNAEHDPYCPFTLTQLFEKDFNYWALGHIHKRQHWEKDGTVIAYSGNIQGRHRKEKGEKGCYLVELSEAGADHVFCPVSELLWEEAEVRVENAKTFDDLMRTCEQTAQAYLGKSPRTFLSLILKGEGEVTGILNDSLLLDLQELLNENAADEESFVYITTVENQAFQPFSERDFIEKSPFLRDILYAAEEPDFAGSSLKDLQQHPLFRKFVGIFTQEEQKQLLAEAKTYLVSELAKEDRG
ncbi:DNA repair exonuclease [Bacillus lacus]|uniref:DNA repair exonuclease n=1 Tax=Metabacillus lacus TaxID=1983721 RepID=A0A7X2LY64_9BACI|nr:DNA repair exonuclease [Metabacillus lacus]MRX71468.1 DNA repair exonuclease [Metabacillus lacus]